MFVLFFYLFYLFVCFVSFFCFLFFCFYFFYSAALKTVVVLFPLLGLCWFFGLVGVMTNSRPFLYAFVILSSLQVCDSLRIHLSFMQSYQLDLQKLSVSIRSSESMNPGTFRIRVPFPSPNYGHNLLSN